MRVFLDANVLVSVLNKEYPVFPFTSRILSLPAKHFSLHTSALSLAIAFYFGSKKRGEEIARERIALFSQHLQITDCSSAEVNAAIKDLRVHDLEDGMQYYSAVHAGCKVIVTSNVNDFYFSSIDIAPPEDFWNRYVVPRLISNKS